MAERPRYRPLASTIPSMPSVDYAAAGRAQGQARMQIADAINRISNFAFEQAEKQAAREGAQYRYDNPVTEEQINTAIKEGRSVDEIVGSQYTVFGRASRATAGAQLRTELESKTRIQLTQIDAAHKEGAITMEQATDMISGLISGNAQVLGSFDPENAIAYSATANTLASSTYKEGLVREYKLRSSARIADADVSMSTMPETLESIYLGDTGALTEKGITEGQASATVALRVMQDNIVSTLDPNYIKTATTELVDIERKARVNALARFSLTEEMAAGDVELNQKLQTGDFGRMTPLYNTLTVEEQASLRVAIRSEKSARDTEAERVRRDDVRQTQSITSSMLFDVRQLDPNSKEFNQTFASLQRVAEEYPEIISPDTLVKLKGDIISGAERVSDPVALFNFERDIRNRKIIDFDQAYARGLELGLAPKDILEAQTKIQTAETREEAKIRRAALDFAKILSENSVNVTSDEAKAVYKFINAVDDEYNNYITQMTNEGKQPTKTKLDFLEQVRSGAINSQHQKRADDIFKTLNTDFGKGNGKFRTNIVFDERTEFDEIEDALRAAGLSNSQLQAVRSSLDAARIQLDKRID